MSHFWNNHVTLAAAGPGPVCIITLQHATASSWSRGWPQETAIRPPRPHNCEHWTLFSQLVGHTFCAKGIKSTCLNYAQCFISKYLRWTTFMVGCTAPHCPSVTSWTCWVGLTTIIFICLIAIAEIAAQNNLYVQQSVAPRTGARQIYPYLAV